MKTKLRIYLIFIIVGMCSSCENKEDEQVNICKIDYNLEDVLFVNEPLFLNIINEDKRIEYFDYQGYLIKAKYGNGGSDPDWQSTRDRIEEFIYDSNHNLVKYFSDNLFAFNFHFQNGKLFETNYSERSHYFSDYSEKYEYQGDIVSKRERYCIDYMDLYNNEILDSTDLYFYKNGLLDSIVHYKHYYNENFERCYRYIGADKYRYNGKNLIESQITIGEYPNDNYSIVFEYDGNDRITKQTYTLMTTGVVYIRTFTYDTYGNITKKQVSRDEKKVFTESYVYINCGKRLLYRPDIESPKNIIYYSR